MASIFPYFGGGTGMLAGLPDWLWQDPRMLEGRPNAMAGGTPAGSFEERWGPAQGAINNGTFDPQGGNQTMAFGGAPQQVDPRAMQAWRDETPMPGMAYDAPQGPPGRQPLAGMNPPRPQQPPPAPSAGGYGGDLSAPPPQIGAPTPQQSPMAGLGNGNPLAGLGGRLAAGGAGFFNAGSPMEAIGNLFGGVMTGQRQDKIGRGERSEQSERAAIYQAVMQRTGDHATALAAASNRDVFKAMAPEMFGAPKLVEGGTDPLSGQKSHFWADAQTRTLTPAQGGGAAAGGDATPGLVAFNNAVKAGVAGEALYDHLPPSMVATVKAMLSGRLPLPSTVALKSPATQAYINVASTIDPTFDATVWKERSKFQTELGSVSPASAGGQTKAFTQGIDHISKLAPSMEKLENWSGFGFPSLAAWGNWARQQGSNEQKANAERVESIGQTVAGEVGKLFSGSAGGGVHERELTRERFKSVGSGPQLASALEATVDMMEGGLRALEQRRDSVGSKAELISAKTREQITQIREAAARLRAGESSPTTKQQPSANDGLLREMKRRGLLK